MATRNINHQAGGVTRELNYKINYELKMVSWSSI